MSFDALQKEVDDWLQQFDPPYWSPLSQLAQLTEEVGELARVLNHKFGDKVKKISDPDEDLEGEIGDILFVLLCLANDQGINLSEAFEKTMHKVKTRDKDRFKRRTVKT